MNNIVLIYNCFMYCCSVTCAINKHDITTKKIYYFLAIFAVNIIILNYSERYAMIFTGIILSIILLFIEKRNWIDTLFEVTSVLCTVLLCILFCTNIFIWMEYINTVIYNFIIGILQLLSILIVTYIKSKFFYDQLKNRIKIISIAIFSMIITMFGFVIPIVLEEPFLTIYSMFSIFTIFLIASTFYSINYMANIEKSRQKYENELKAAISYQENMTAIWNEAIKKNHYSLSLFNTTIQYIDNDDFTGFKKYFYSHVEPNIKAEPIKIIRLNNIQDELIRNLIYYQLKRADSMNIPIELEIRGIISDFDMDSSVLFKVLTIFIDNAIEASTRLKEPLITFIIQNHENYISIELRNRFNPKKNRSISLNKGHGLELAGEYLKKYKNVSHQKEIQNNTYIQKLVIGRKNSESHTI